MPPPVSGVDKTGLKASMRDWLMDDVAFEEVLKTCPGGFDLVPCNSDLTAAEVELLALHGREAQLRRRLADAADAQRYSYLIMDCPPSLNILTLNALVAADSVLIPMQCEYYALEGLTGLLDTINEIRRRANPRLTVQGLLRTMYDPRNGLTRDVLAPVDRTLRQQGVPHGDSPQHSLGGSAQSRLAGPSSMTAIPEAPSPTWRWPRKWSSPRTPDGHGPETLRARS